MIFVDANYFLRFLLCDNDTQYQTAKNLFLKGAGGEIDIMTSVVVFFEISWVLEDFYKKGKEDQIKALRGVLDMEFIKLEQRNLLYRALDLFEKGADLEDAYHMMYAQSLGAKEVATFDKKMIKFWNQLARKA